MSDFDREAEREKLREKYEADQADREATERMSDLLLKGATMTNAHCGTCGDPIFRHEGQEFCPTCQEVVSQDGAETGTGGADADGASPSQGEDGTEAAGDVEDGRTAPTEARAPAEAPSDAVETPTPTDEASTDVPADPTPQPRGTSRAESAAPETGDVTSDRGLATARASLTRTVTRLARHAEEAENLERVRAYLAATEDAADALAAVEDADR
jgi:uncharacterized Zn finger protein (UPF0148 family)